MIIDLERLCAVKIVEIGQTIDIHIDNYGNFKGTCLRAGTIDRIDLERCEAIYNTGERMPVIRYHVAEKPKSPTLSVTLEDIDAKNLKAAMGVEDRDTPATVAENAW